MKKINYHSTNSQNYTVDEWFKMLQEDNCFTPALITAIYVLIFEMDGKGSAKQISEITGSSYQRYNFSMAQTVKQLRKKGYIFVTDIREDNKKERYWGHFFKGYYDKGLFIWEVKDTLYKAFIKYNNYIMMFDEMNDLHFNNKVAIKNEATEGMRHQRIHYQFERNPAIVNDAKSKFIKEYGELFCEACNFSFNKTYGIDFIEAHHILPLCMGERVTKMKDLIMLCANCHRAIHNKIWNDKPIDDFLEYMKDKLTKC